MIKNNISFSSYRDVKAIVEPLTQYLNLNYFGFSRIFTDKKFFNLASDFGWPEYHYLEKELPPSFWNNPHDLENKTLLPTLNDEDRFGWPKGTLRQIKELFEISHPILVTRKYKHYSDLFAFSFKVESPYDFFLNHFEIVEQFLFYFKDKASNLISEASANPLCLHDGKLYENNNILNAISDENFIKEMMTALLPKQYVLHYDDHEILINPKQYQVLSYVALGFSNKSIAEKMNLSPRTIEGYVIFLLQKFNLFNKGQLVDVYYHNHEKINRAILK